MYVQELYNFASRKKTIVKTVNPRINVNTVKSRLNTARITVKKQMENDSMEKYEKQSYEPEQLDIWVYGDMMLH